MTPERWNLGQVLKMIPSVESHKGLQYHLFSAVLIPLVMKLRYRVPGDRLPAW